MSLSALWLLALKAHRACGTLLVNGNWPAVHQPPSSLTKSWIQSSCRLDVTRSKGQRCAKHLPSSVVLHNMQKSAQVQDRHRHCTGVSPLGQLSLASRANMACPSLQVRWDQPAILSPMCGPRCKQQQPTPALVP